MTSITINEPGLTQIAITVTPTSTVRETERRIGSQEWIGLEIDGQFTPLVLWKHLVGNKMIRVSLDAALAVIQAAITPLPASYRTEIVFDRETADYALYVNDDLIGFAKTNYLGEQKINKHIMDSRYGQRAA